MSYRTPLEETIQRTGVFRCLECGKCTAVCPISHYDRQFSPRRTVGRALMRRDEALLADDRLWACLTCLHCSQVCPSAVTYSDLTLGVRTEAQKLGRAGVCTHGEAIHSWMRMMTDPALEQNRLDWLTGSELRVSDSSDTLYFVGCAPYFDAQFCHIGIDGTGVARATLRILNALQIEPQVLAGERCCGHDLLWEGDVDGFRVLAQLNAALIRQSGARRVVTACPECARALKLDYAAHDVGLDVEVLHLAQLLAANGWQAAGPEPSKLRVTFQDPCRLGRHLGIYDAPRQVIQAAGFELLEMARHRENALCCGTNGWTHCGAANRQIQGCRLQEAQSSGADVLVTACLKCQIHFKCALQDQELAGQVAIEIKDLAVLLAGAWDRRRV